MNFDTFRKQYEQVPVTVFPNRVAAQPLVTVCVYTYQHAAYVKDCLESVLMQQTSFPFEILIGEDGSTDGTRDICIDYASRFPDRIRLLLHDRGNNIQINNRPTGKFNFLYSLYVARGQFIAICEGDDYWLDPGKLQKQVDYLMQHPQSTLCFHPTRMDFINEEKPSLIEGPKQPASAIHTFSSDEAIRGLGIRTVSMVFRSSLAQELPDWFMHTPYGDLPLKLICSCEGSVGFINEVMAVYRRGVAGAWSDTQNKIFEWHMRRFENHLQIYRYVWQHYAPMFQIPITAKMNQIVITNLIDLQDHCKKSNALSLMRRYRSGSLVFKNKRAWLIWLRFLFGKQVYRWLKRGRTVMT